MVEPVSFSGVITKVTADGRSAVVTLSENVGGRALAVISPQTKGRVGLMAGTGHLTEGKRVVGLATPGVDALKAVTVTLAAATSSDSAP